MTPTDKVLSAYACPTCVEWAKQLLAQSEHRALILRGALGLPSPIDIHRDHGGDFDTHGLVPDEA